jgi:hypothetical protein
MHSFDNPDITNSEGTKPPKMDCYNSFEEFAYIFPEISYPREPTNPLLPTQPWQIETSFPNEFVEDYNISGLGIEVKFARLVDGNPEIWLARPGRYLKEDIQSILIYHPTSGKWQYVSDVVENTNIFISDIFLTRDGIWGLNSWSRTDANPKKVPILSKFNEETQQFEFALGILEVSSDESQSVNVEIIVDHKDDFWFLLETGSFYHYDPIAKITIKQGDFPDINPTRAILSIDGSIYFENRTYKGFVSANPMYSIYSGQFYRFIPESRELIQLDIPDEPWPSGGSIYVTKTGHLWLGAVGYKDLHDGSWHLLHPDPDYHFELGFWSHSPSIMLESSNGLLWFNKYTDAYKGTAWYDPETKEGCMFTDISANIIEDSQQQLWMFADGKLYRYSLNE